MSGVSDDAILLALELADDYDLCEQKLFHFVQAAWHILEPHTEMKDNWHLGLVCEHLEAVHLGQITRLILNEPPRCMKSIKASVCFPVWEWISMPWLRFICTSHSADLSSELSVNRRRLIQSGWYQTRWAKNFELTSDQNVKTEFENDHRGKMKATSTGGSILGRGGNRIIIDDPQDPKEAASEVKRKHATDYIDKTLFSRLNDPKKDAIILVMQRLTERDPTGHVLAKNSPIKWTHLEIPAEAPRKMVYYYPISKKKKILKKGELLWPDRLGSIELADIKENLGSAQYQAQYQQDPRPASGGFFNRKWWGYYTELPGDVQLKAQFWDCAEKPGLTNDYSARATWNKAPLGFYCQSAYRKKMAFPDLERAVIAHYEDERPDIVVIEDKSAGTQLIQRLRANTNIPVYAYQPGGRSKVVRAAAATPTVEAGKCFLLKGASWLEDFIKEHEFGPEAADNDDWIDDTSMMVEYFREISNTGPRILRT